MKAATISPVWKQLTLIFVFLSTGVHGKDKPTCSSTELSFEKLNNQIQNVSDCLGTLSVQWKQYQNAAILNHLLVMKDIIQKQQKTECETLLPANCSAPTVHSDGGLLCVSVEKKIYCKPMCNKGFDFDFIRISRLYEECSAATQNKWTTQYIGGNRLAVCNKSPIQVAGSPSAFFPEGTDCHGAKSDEKLMGDITKIFQSELVKAGIKEPFQSFCLLCG